MHVCILWVCLWFKEKSSIKIIISAWGHLLIACLSQWCISVYHLQNTHTKILIWLFSPLKWRVERMCWQRSLIPSSLLSSPLIQSQLSAPQHVTHPKLLICLFWSPVPFISSIFLFLHSNPSIFLDSNNGDISPPKKKGTLDQAPLKGDTRI